MLNSAAEEGRRDQWFGLLYEELRQLAHCYFQHERRNHTLQPTAIVHEAYLRLVKDSEFVLHDRFSFYCAAAQAMRRVLIDHARRCDTRKRGGHIRRIQLTEDFAMDLNDLEGVLALKEALEKLHRINSRRYWIIMLRFFCTLLIYEIADIVGVCTKTVTKELEEAIVWLRDELDGDGTCPPK
ncbi:MAG: ECF-type sigma factor [Phycisphaerales bacterium]|nr:ECF-type sigma factor [Phycisphaerales bacterium]